MFKIEEKKIQNFQETEMSFKELCESLDKQHKRYLA